jgi:hypothetical protein
MPPTFSLLHSTARTHGWQNACRIWRINADHPESCEYVLGIHARQNELPGNADVQFSDYLMFCGHEVSQIWPGLNGKVVVNRLRPCAVDSANVTAVNSQGKILVGIADGLRPCPHWDTKLLEVIDDPDKPYMIQTSHGDYLPDTWPFSRGRFTSDGDTWRGRNTYITALMTTGPFTRSRKVSYWTCEKESHFRTTIGPTASAKWTN